MYSLHPILDVVFGWAHKLRQRSGSHLILQQAHHVWILSSNSIAAAPAPFFAFSKLLRPSSPLPSSSETTISHPTSSTASPGNAAAGLVDPRFQPHNWAALHLHPEATKISMRSTSTLAPRHRGQGAFEPAPPPMCRMLRLWGARAGNARRPDFFFFVRIWPFSKRPDFFFDRIWPFSKLAVGAALSTLAVSAFLKLVVAAVLPPVHLTAAPRSASSARACCIRR